MQIKFTANQTSITTISIPQTIFQQMMPIFPPKTANSVLILVLLRVTHPVAPAGNEGQPSNYGELARKFG
ncbi:hypothetical protein CD31_22150 [Lysinibacillus boronitolerans JCM 21713 = 10a = NBRC 103108]|uniref:Uncharacterized protein n=1 Tax=Lysinibacillus boronitolerans JCM 21713 = 10a = NBRC 103108 TaxID=1294264 RepID=A0ABR4XTT7_9BACI|nr:hypothetical protein CD31_22150 [Lysinibacillus boronitolerans JCM 21713 = 10a = NBRC 103108]